MYAIHWENFLSIEIYILTALLSFKKKSYIFLVTHGAVFGSLVFFLAYPDLCSFFQQRISLVKKQGSYPRMFLFHWN